MKLKPNIAFPNSMKASFAISLDLVKQQNNSKIKRVGSVAVLLSSDLESTLRSWEVVGAELCWLPFKYEQPTHLYEVKGCSSEKHIENDWKYNENKINNVLRSFRDLRKPFQKENLVNFHMNSGVVLCLATSLGMNK